LCEREEQQQGGGGGRGGVEENVRFTLFVRPYLDSNSTHGTGCTLSAALACALARGDTGTCVVGFFFGLLNSLFDISFLRLQVVEAVKFATTYTHYGIATAFPVGHGHGPLNHMHSILPRMVQRRVHMVPPSPPFLPANAKMSRGFLRRDDVIYRPTPNDPYPLVRMLIRSNADIWKQYVEHDFVRQLGQGTLSRDRFVHFIKCAAPRFSLSFPFMAVLYLPTRSYHFQAGLSLPQILRSRKRVNSRSDSPIHRRF
jgi:hydroxymethylpyrimidine/phosphomethylpyrimidine kinase / thiaminase